MKKTLALLLAAIMCIGMFAGCKNDKTPSANNPGTVDPGNNDDPGNVTPDTPKPDAEPPAPVVEPTYVNMMVWGDSVMCGYNMVDILAAFAKADGVIINTYAATYDNRKEGTTYSLYEMYKFDGSDADSQIVRMNTDIYGAKIVSTNLADTDKTIDYFLMLVSRERGITMESANGRILTSLKDLDSRYQANNPNGKFLFLAGPAFKEGFAEQESTLYKKLEMDKMNISFPNQHNDLIKAHAQEMVQAVKTDSEVLTLGDAFLKYYEQYYATVGADFYDEDLRTLSPAGSYFAAAYLYATIFGKSPAKIPVNGFIPEDEAKLLREAAHEIAFGTSASSVDRDYDFVYIKEDTTVKPEYAHEVYPEYFDVLLTALKAYENRGTMVQYDQTAMNRATLSSVRRTVVNSYPENNSPQKFLYFDCSSFIHSLFGENFSYNFSGANKVSQLLKETNGVVYHFQGETVNGSTLDPIEETDGITQIGYINGLPVTDIEARAALLEVLQPGDVVVWGDYVDGGHCFLYLGNGQVTHCAGRQKGAFQGTDYDYNKSLDILEMSPSGILRDSITKFIDDYLPDGYDYMFKAIKDIKVIRPFSLDIEPYEEAIARHEKLQDIIAYKETTAFEGVTVSAGGDVTITYTVKNIGGYKRTVQIVDTLPAALSYKSGDGDYANGVITIDAEIAPYSTSIFTYIVTVDAKTADGTIIDCDTKMSGVRMNLTPITVGNTLSLDEQAGIKAKAEAAAQKSATDFDFIVNLYKDGFNYTLPFKSGKDLFNKVFKIEGVSCTFNNTYDMSVSPLFGGKFFYTPGTNAYQRLQYPFSSNFVPGDIIVINSDGDAGNTAFWVYTADNTFMTAENGKAVTLTGSATQSFRESLFGNYCFCVLRPSLGYFKEIKEEDTTDPSVTPSDSTVDGRVLVLGDIPLAENELTATLSGMLGSEYSVYSEAYASTPSTAGSRLEPYELFKFEGNICIGWSTGARGKRIAEYIGEGIPEYIVIDTGRRSTLDESSSAHTKTLAAFKWLSRNYPDTKIIAVAMLPYPDGSFTVNISQTVTIGESYTGTTAAEHAAIINAFAAKCAEGLENVQVVKVSDAFLAAAQQNIALYGTEGAYITHPNADGSYLISCMLYKAITGKTATGTANKLQAIADSIATSDTLDHPAEPSASTVDGRVLILGDIPLAENELAATLSDMLGSEYSIYSEAYAIVPSTAGSRLEPYELFKFEGTTCIGWSTGARGRRVAEYIGDGIPEYIIIDTGRRSTLDESSSAHTKTLAAFKWLSNNYPDTKIIAVAMLPYPDGSFTVNISQTVKVGESYTGTTAAEHAAIINAFAAKCAEGLENIQVVKVSDAFLAAAQQNIALYKTDGGYITHPNADGSYLISCMLYKAITGKNISSITIDGELQAIADSIK